MKVGIIGLDTPAIRSWSRPQLVAGLEFTDSVETLRRIVPEVRAAGAQVLVLVCHQGYREGGDDHANQISAIARNFPELDVIIGAHTHRNFPEFKVGNILYSQADYYGIHLGRVDLVYDTEKGRVTKRQSNTLLMDENIPLDGEIMKLAAPEIDRAEKFSSTVLGEATDDFMIRALPHKETAVHDLIFQAIAEALQERGVKVDAIVHGISDRRSGLKKGVVTVGDVWKVLPYENTQGVFRLNKAQLLEILEEDAAKYNTWDFRGIWGLKWTFDPKAPVGHRTVSLTHADGSTIKDDESLSVAFNSYDLASGGTRWKKVEEYADQPDSGLVEYDFQTRQAVIDYVRKQGKISPEVGGWWTVVGKTKETVGTPTNSASPAAK